MRRKVKEIMTKTASLAVISEDSNLFEAILAIGSVREINPEIGFRCPGALVANGKRTITGFLDFRKLLKSLEPRYSEIADSVKGFPAGRVKSELEKHGLWADALDEVCKKVGDILVKNLATAPTQDQITDANASLGEALFQMVISGNDYLFVKDGEVLAGTISLCEIVSHIYDTVKGCRI